MKKPYQFEALRAVKRLGAFTSVAELSGKIMKYIRAYAKSARPFSWTD